MYYYSIFVQLLHIFLSLTLRHKADLVHNYFRTNPAFNIQENWTGSFNAVPDY